MGRWGSVIQLLAPHFSVPRPPHPRSLPHFPTLQVPDVSGIIERLLLFLDSGSEALTAEALVQMKDLLRRYPDVAQV